MEGLVGDLEGPAGSQVACWQDFNTPPLMTHRAPVPAQAMHLRNPRRSTPSCSWFCDLNGSELEQFAALLK